MWPGWSLRWWWVPSPRGAGSPASGGSCAAAAERAPLARPLATPVAYPRRRDIQGGRGEHMGAERARIGIIGAGAIGCVVGGLLARAGHDVTLVDPWPEHVEQIKAAGLGRAGSCGG